jgi:hypothetical protein
MKNRLFRRLICIIATVCLVVPLFAVRVSAYDITSENGNSFNENFENALNGAVSSFTFEGYSEEELEINFDFALNPLDITFRADAQNSTVVLAYGGGIPQNGGSFTMTGGNIDALIVGDNLFGLSRIEISKNAVIERLDIYGGIVYIEQGNPIDINNINDDGGTYQFFTRETADPPARDTKPDPAPEKDEEVMLSGTHPGLKPGDLGDGLTAVITDDEPFEQNGLNYEGIVDIKNFYTDTPKEIPKELFINGKRYLVGDTIYIVAKKDLEIVGYTETGVSYVFPAVENSDNPATFTAEGLPEGVTLSEDGVLSTETLPLTAGEYIFTVTVDNGVDTNTIGVKLTIKGGYASDDELQSDLTQNDKEDQPEVLIDDGGEIAVAGVPRFWMNESVRLHYPPEMEYFDEVFLNGRQLVYGTDYTVEAGSTVIILTEQTIAPLPNGDYVVTTMFHQDSDVGLDTVINDVGSSSFVFRFGDGTDGKRVNIGGDGVTGSVTFDDKNTTETPITTISANTEAIEQRANNLSNATGKEIIAAFETKQTGGFGGKTATFAVSVKSLDLTLKNGTAVFVAVYDAKTGKTYQNKGEVKDGMIVFKTKHSGVFMISLEKF